MTLINLARENASVGAVLPLFTLSAILSLAQLAIAQTCVEEQAGKSMICAASDVRVAFADNIRNASGESMTECVNGKTFSFVADFHVQTTVKARYDIGLYFATDGDPNGDGAGSGLCSATVVRDRHLDPQSPNAVMLGAAAAANLDGNACGDINADYGWRRIGGRSVTVRVDNALCQDSDGDGKLNLPNCASWSKHPGGVCNSPENAAPNSPSNCNCNIAFNIPIDVRLDTNQVAKDSQSESPAESGRDLSLLSDSELPRESHP